jgi:hypothetical protein
VTGTSPTDEFSVSREAADEHPAPYDEERCRLTRTTKVAAVFGVVVLLAIGTSVARRGHGTGIAACDIFNARTIENALGAPVGAGTATSPESGAPSGTTLCVFARVGGPSLSVFAVSPGASFYASQKRAAQLSKVRDLSRAGYQAFGVDTGQGIDTFFLLKHDQYVNVLIRDAPSGGVDLLTPLAARAIG